MKRFLLLVAAAGCASQPARIPPIALDDVFASPRWVDASPSTPQWDSTGAHFAFVWKDSRELWVADRDGKNLRAVAEGPITSFGWTGASLLFIRGGGLWRVGLGGEAEQIGEVGTGASELRVAPGRETVTFLRGGDLWATSIAGEAPKRLTDIGLPSPSRLAVGRYNRRDREIGPGIWGGPTYAWSPDGKRIAVHLVDRTGMRSVPFPDYLAEETDPNVIRRGYPGDANESRTVGLLDPATGELTRLSIAEPSAHQVVGFAWSESGTLLIDIASDTAVDRSLYTLKDGELRRIWNHSRPSRIYTRFASAWARETVIFLSDLGDRYGLYALGPNDTEARLLTDPSFDVLTGPTVRGDSVFFAGNGVSPAELHVYRVDLPDGDCVRLTSAPGQNRGFPSPDGDALAVLHSDDRTPREIFVDDRPLTDSTRDEFTPERWSTVRYVEFPSAIDDYTLRARILEPVDLDRSRKHPVIFGPVYSNTARNRWSPRYSMVQQLLAAKGYIVVQVDVRGSDGYGRAFREEFLEDFAGDDLEDLSSAVTYMKTLPYVDPERFGVWGSSYGGTLTVYSLLKKPGLFRAGVAAAAAVDPSFFGTDDVAIVRRPDSAPEIFARKAKAYAGALEDELLIIHGLQDQVVPVKATMDLVEALIAADKDFDIAIGPGATHSWARESRYSKFLFRKLINHFDRVLRP
ncbi:MAG: prolyl oligopeptidase family serine peptidase [Myxococcota bacterium]